MTGRRRQRSTLCRRFIVLYTRYILSLRQRQRHRYPELPVRFFRMKDPAVILENPAAGIQSDVGALLFVPLRGNGIGKLQPRRITLPPAD